MTDNFAPELGRFTRDAIWIGNVKQPPKRRPPAAQFIPSAKLLELAADALELPPEGLGKLLGVGTARFDWLWNSAAELSGREAARLAWLLIFKFDGYNFAELAERGIDWAATLRQITERGA